MSIFVPLDIREPKNVSFGMGETEIYDLGIIGGGIAGAGIARDAASRGVRTILFEKNTFGSGTSSKSSKLIHGGIRYLELAWLAFLQGKFREGWENFRFVFLSLRETQILEKTAPDLIQPIQLVIPIYQDQGRSPLAIYFGAYLYSFLAFLIGSRRKPLILPNAAGVLNRIPNLRAEGLKGGVAIWDHTTNDQELVERVMVSAVKKGAKALERTRVTRYQWNAGRYEVQTEAGTFFCRRLINASGAWVDQVQKLSGQTSEPYIVPIAGAHLQFKKFVQESAILQAADKRIFFVINRGEFSRVGTTERPNEDPDHVPVTMEEEQYLLDALRFYFPSENFDPSQIQSRDAGVRPLARPENNTAPNAISREHKIRKSTDGVLHVLGVKLTDHRRAAEEIVDSLISDLNPTEPRSSTATDSF